MHCWLVTATWLCLLLLHIGKQCQQNQATNMINSLVNSINHVIKDYAFNFFPLPPLLKRPRKAWRSYHPGMVAEPLEVLEDATVSFPLLSVLNSTYGHIVWSDHCSAKTKKGKKGSLVRSDPCQKTVLRYTMST